MGTRIGFVASEKGAEKECDVGLGLRMQKTTKTNNNNNNNKSFRGKKMMMMDMSMSGSTTHPHHHHHHDHHHNNDGDNEPSLVVDNNGGFSEEQQHCCGGPLFCNASNSNTSMGDIYDVASLLIPNSQTLMSYNSSGVMVSSANVRHNIPNFTPSQRQELETQTMIYKYMMASIPVPPQLLIPITKTTPNFSTRSLELGISSNSSDSEPWRCRRTDGKKWRCSRNVVPDQKYCERHSHKTRPRSRKHVELNSHFNNNINNTNNNNNMPYSKPSSLLDQREKNQPAFSATSHDQPRGLEWFMKGHEVANSTQDWHQILQAKPPPPPPQQQQQHHHQHGLKATDFISHNSHNHSHQAFQQQTQGFFLDPPNMATPSHQTRRFIDAWSAAAERDRMGHRKMPFSSLSLSMHGGESEENAQMGFGIQGDFLRPQWMINNNNNDDDENDNDNNININANDAVSWNNGSPPGGPLAEALCLGMAGSSTRESSSRSS